MICIRADDVRRGQVPEQPRELLAHDAPYWTVGRGDAERGARDYECRWGILGPRPAPERVARAYADVSVKASSGIEAGGTTTGMPRVCAARAPGTMYSA